MFDDDSDNDRAELKAEDEAKRRYHRQLMQHPDPRDPDYPVQSLEEE